MEPAAQVKVAVRVRPLTPKEHLQNTNECISYLPPQSADQKTSTLLLDSTRSFTFDYIFPPDTSQPTVFESVRSMCEKFVEGYNTTVLAYGQTGSGKTFTMGTGLNMDSTEIERDSFSVGIIPRAIDLIFELLQKKDDELKQEDKGDGDEGVSFKFSMSVTFLELYNEELIDLLNPHTRSSAKKGSALTIREDSSGNVFWAGVKEEMIREKSDLLSYLRKGSVCRTTGSTDMNLTSSRSHAIYSIILRQEVPQGSDMKRISSKFHFVDLAGSERMKKTKAVGDRAKEGISINSGLLAMGKVIHALNDGASHVPYRDSKLTRLLQDALGGNSETLMIACVSPADSNFGETLNTLNYASRARNIKNRVVQNQDYQAMEVHQLRAEISRLKMELLTVRSQQAMPKTTGLSNQASISSNGEWLRKENENFISEIKKLEMLVYHLQQKNTELRDELTIVRSERDSLLFVNNSSGDGGDPSVNPIIANYQHIISELEARVEELTLNNPQKPSLISHSRSKLLSSSSESLLTNSQIQQSPLHRRINETIEKAKQEIMKERDLLEQTRATTPKFDDLPDNDDEDDDLNPTKTEDDMLQLLDQITSDIRIKEELVTQLQNTQSEYHVMKETYEEKLKQMQDQIQAIQRERDVAIKNIHSVDDRDKNQLTMVKAKYEDRLKKLTNEMSDLRKKYQDAQREMANKRHTNEALISSMRVHVESLKKEKLRLLKRMKEKEMISRDREQERERELQMLKRKEKQAADLARKLERSNKMQKLILKKRNEEIVQKESKLRSLMSAALKKTKIAASPLTKKAWKQLQPTADGLDQQPQTPTKSFVDEERVKVQAQFKKNLLLNHIDSLVSTKQNNSAIDELVSKRDRLQTEKQDLEEELAQLNSRLDVEKQTDETSDQVAMIVQLRQDVENRLDIIDAEIQYYSARLKSIQLEMMAQNTCTVEDQDGYDSVVEMVQSLSSTEARKLLELMLDDLISLKLQERQKQVEIQALYKDKEELKKTVDVMKKSAVENVINSMNTQYKPSNENTTNSILGDMRDLEEDMLEIENALQMSPRGRSKSMDLLGKNETRHNKEQKPPFIPASSSISSSQNNSNSNLSTKLSSLLAASKDSKERLDNVFERLHREQTIASQMKMREGHHPQASDLDLQIIPERRTSTDGPSKQ